MSYIVKDERTKPFLLALTNIILRRIVFKLGRDQPPVLTGDSLDGRPKAWGLTRSEAFAAHGRVRTLVLDLLEVGVELAGLRRRHSDFLERVDA